MVCMGSKAARDKNDTVKRNEKQMDIQKALSAIRKGTVQPVYLVLGQERYLADSFRREIVKAALSDDEIEFNLAHFDLKETPVSLALEDALSIPFFGDYRIVFLDNPSFLTGEKKASDVEHNMEEFAAYLEQPSPSTILVIMAPYEKLDERKKIVKKLKATSEIIDVSRMNEKTVKDYTQKYLSNEGYEISQEAFDLLLRLTDMELSKVMMELPKLLLYSSDTKSITKKAVEDLVPKSLENNIFDMVTFVMSGKTEQALVLYQDLILQGEETIKINAILVGQFRLLVQAKILMDLGYQQKNIAEVLKIHPYRVKLAMQQARGFQLNLLGKVLDELVENEFKMKTGQMEKELLFELFILKTEQQLKNEPIFVKK